MKLELISVLILDREQIQVSCYFYFEKAFLRKMFITFVPLFFLTAPAKLEYQSPCQQIKILRTNA